VHISELAPHHVENPREVVTPGDEIRVKILEIDSERRRLSLSVKRVEDQVLPATGYVPPADGESDDAVDEGEDPGPPNAPEDPEAEAAAAPSGEAGDLDDVPSLELSEDVFADNERS
jgi:small subunit ribosomal protein S1